MARTVIPVTTVTNAQRGTALSTVSGDRTNDHEINMTVGGRKTHLLLWNATGNSPSCQLTYAATTPRSYYRAATRTFTATANKITVIILDVPSELYTAGDTYPAAVLADSADANFDSLELAAFTWLDSPRAGAGYNG